MHILLTIGWNRPSIHSMMATTLYYLHAINQRNFFYHIGIIMHILRTLYTIFGLYDKFLSEVYVFECVVHYKNLGIESIFLSFVT